MTQWRVTPDGEKQWHSADGNWYSSESAALLAGLQDSDGNRMGAHTFGDPMVLPLPPLQPAAAPPVVYQRAVPPPRRKRKVKWGRVVLVAAVFIGIVAYFQSKSSGDGDIHHQVYAVVVLDAQHVRIFIRWTNEGKSAASATCSLQASAYSPFGDEIGSGFDSTGTNGNLSPGQTQVTRQDLVITDNNAAGVTSKKDILITGC